MDFHKQSLTSTKFSETEAITQCKELIIKNAQVSHNGSVEENTVVTVTCNKPGRHVLLGGHVLFGEKEVTCVTGGTWSHQPECRRPGNFSICSHVLLVMKL